MPLHFAFISTCYFVRIMENHQTMSEKFEKFTWTINNNFSVLVEFDKYQFVFGGYTWSISVAIDENRLMDFILDVVDWIQGHSITANFKFSVVNQRVDTLVKSIAIDGQVRFTEDTHRGSCVFSWRTSLNPLELTFNDNLIIVAEFFVKESPHHHNQLDDGIVTLLLMIPQNHVFMFMKILRTQTKRILFNWQRKLVISIHQSLNVIRTKIIVLCSPSGDSLHWEECYIFLRLRR
ncbi:uncharacterized protein [Arachis hypogaea]|uniref:uncharacterized protein n=1 Tax=Arachis hypogaea TaxID=3818 RepID=UPI000DEC79AD|nr:uncharacterized protein LOC112720454 [Arachis hypogaea]